MSVVTRFAPSPTGDLHIGGARTALFAWLYARGKGGKFLLRIEDTDKERSTDAAVQTIIDGLDWLGLTTDEDPVFQSQRSDRHREVVDDLLNRGAAYRCYLTPEELEMRRSAAEAVWSDLRSLKAEVEATTNPTPEQTARLAKTQEAANEVGRAFRSPFRDPDQELPATDAPHVVRLKVPDDRPITINDAVQGTVTISTDEIDDYVLLRSDGTPTYMLAVVVDDHDMGVTHIIRGDDHFRNTFRQAPIIQSLGWPAPTYAHVPLIHGLDGKKLSKRHGAQNVTAFRDLGYLPEGVKNYLLRLGWSHGDEEIISEQQAISWFDLPGLNKAPARLDLDKLNSVNAHYMKLADNDRLSALLADRPELQSVSTPARARILGSVAKLKDRAANLAELTSAAGFLADIRPIALTGKRAKLVTPDSVNHLNQLRNRLENLDAWKEETLKNALDRYCEESSLGIGKIGPVVRAVLTGGLPSPDLAIVMELLGREECLARLGDFAG